MPTLIWKVRFALHMRKRAAVPFLRGFEMAGSWAEWDGTETDPKDAADEEISNWDGDM